MNDSESKDEPKLIIDDDWKEQVQKEKDALRAAEAEKASAEAEKASGPADDSAAGKGPAVGKDVSAEEKVESAENAADDQAPPPASFVTLVSMLFTQAMAMLGQIPDPTTGKPSVDKPIAKHYIDTLEILEAKTKGNLQDDESKMLAEALHALRMTYVSVKA